MRNFPQPLTQRKLREFLGLVNFYHRFITHCAELMQPLHALLSMWQPLSYFSRKLKPAETRYSTFDRELLAIYLAIKHFRHFLEGRHFHVLTDHKPLVYTLDTHSDRHSPRQARLLDYISQFTTTIRHIKGPENTAADALSRMEMNALLTGTPPVIDFPAMARKSGNESFVLKAPRIST